MLPVWKILPVQWAHELAPHAIHVAASIFGQNAPRGSVFEWEGLHFPSRVGIAGGVDKNGVNIRDWARLGAGFVEVGTVTPRPQGPNPGRIIDRDWQSKTLWNKMGFPNHGADEVYFNIKSQKPDLGVPLFVNIGRNRDTDNEKALQDYLAAAERLAPLADALVVNVSSPNTSGLRDLQNRKYLESLLKGVRDQLQSNKLLRPLLVKLSPDLDEADLIESLAAAAESGARGVILCNTTLRRESHTKWPKDGGLSGGALKPFAISALKRARECLDKKMLVVSVGGVATAADIKERLDLGADLVQVYSALVFSGPRFFQKTVKEKIHAAKV